MVGTPRARVIDQPVQLGDNATQVEAERVALLRGKRRPQVIAAIGSIQAAATQGSDEALKNERAIFDRLRVGTEAQSLRHLFFAERDALRRAKLGGNAGLPISRPAVVGGGTMGVGIAIAMLDAGFPVQLVERDQATLGQAIDRINKYYHDAVTRGRLSAVAAHDRQARLAGFADHTALDKCDLVLEAVFEDIAVKHELLAQLDAIIASDAVLATNTSYLRVGKIAEATDRCGRVIGLHFFSPANIMRLVEVVRHDKVDPASFARTTDFARRLGKLPIVSEDSFGFIGNRIFAAYRRQAEFLVEEGASPELVDSVIEDFGFAMGPFAVADLAGLDIAWRMRRAGDDSRPPTERYVSIADKLVGMGRLGRKTGAGWFRYPTNGRRGEADSIVAKVIQEAAREKGLRRNPIAADIILNRLLVTIVNEAAMLFAEGVAACAADIDLVLVNGYGFPAHEGGPLHWAKRQPRLLLKAVQIELKKCGGSEFRIGDLAPLLYDDTCARVGVEL